MIVMKFGGTSVEDASAIARLRDIVKDRRDQQPVVVMSAKVTDASLKAAVLSAAGDECRTCCRLEHLHVGGDLLVDCDKAHLER